LKSGDIIMGINGKAVHNAHDALNIIVRAHPKIASSITLMRGGKTLKMKVLPSQRPLIQ
jgi:S1-C subfamily serine protease